MTGQVQGKVALVTGGASGIGEAVSELLAREGATVAVSDVDDLKGPEVVARINPAVVNIDATARGRDARGRRGRSAPNEVPGPPLEEFGPRNRGDMPRRGAGSGFHRTRTGSGGATRQVSHCSAAVRQHER